MALCLKCVKALLHASDTSEKCNTESYGAGLLEKKPWKWNGMGHTAWLETPEASVGKKLYIEIKFGSKNAYIKVYLKTQRTPDWKVLVLKQTCANTGRHLCKYSGLSQAWFQS